MIEKTGDLFTTKKHAIGHGVNTRGVMGAGIAVEFKERFPKNYQKYVNKCSMSVGNSLTGGQFLITVEIDQKDDTLRHVVNLATQNSPGPHAQYTFVFDAARAAANELRRQGVMALALPQIGCGIGGLEWDKVKTLLAAVEVLVPGFEFELWTYM